MDDDIFIFFLSLLLSKINRKAVGEIRTSGFPFENSNKCKNGESSENMCMESYRKNLVEIFD